MAEEDGQLHDELAEFIGANEILRAASAYFAQKLDPTRPRSRGSSTNIVTVTRSCRASSIPLLPPAVTPRRHSRGPQSRGPQSRRAVDGRLGLARPNYTLPRSGQTLADQGSPRRCGTVGDSFDDAPEVENFSYALKTEFVDRTAWPTQGQAENALSTHIDGWYNIRRIQRWLGYRGPAEYEALVEADEHTPAPANQPSGGTGRLTVRLEHPRPAGQSRHGLALRTHEDLQIPRDYRCYARTLMTTAADIATSSRKA